MPLPAMPLAIALAGVHLCGARSVIYYTDATVFNLRLFRCLFVFIARGGGRLIAGLTRQTDQTDSWASLAAKQANEVGLLSVPFAEDLLIGRERQSPLRSLWSPDRYFGYFFL